MTTPALKSLNVSSLNHHHTYKPASRPGLQGILWILNSYSSYSAMLKMKFRKENRTKSGFTFLKMRYVEKRHLSESSGTANS